MHNFFLHKNILIFRRFFNSANRLLHILDDDIFLPDQYRQERIDEILNEIARIDDMYYSYYNKGENDKRTIEVWKIISLLLALIFGGGLLGMLLRVLWTNVSQE